MAITTNTNINTNPTTNTDINMSKEETGTNKLVQHVTKKSSDELLMKFADEGELVRVTRVKRPRICTRSKRSREEPINAEETNGGGLFGEAKSLLPSRKKNKSLLLKQLRAREIKNKSLFVAIEKTWRRTLEGASRVLLDKHYNRHRRLINDVV